MKMTVCGVQRMAGTSKAGSAFDMSQVFALIPVESGGGKIQFSGSGFKVMEIAATPEAVASMHGLKFPLLVDLEMEPRPRGGRVETVVVGVVGQRAAA